MKKYLLAAVLLIPVFLYGQETGASQTPAKTIEETRSEILRYGTENEVGELVQVLKNEKAEYLDRELAALVKTTKNGKILSVVFSFFGEREKTGLEERALEALEHWDEEGGDTVQAAVDYLGKMREARAAEPLKMLIETDNNRFINISLRALGRIGNGNSESSASIADYLIKYYEDGTASDDTMREIIISLGELGDLRGVKFLAGIAQNNDERPTRRISAMQSLSKIGDTGGLQAIISSIHSQDPNVRTAAVAALGPFEGGEVDEAILEAFRDNFWRTRVAAAQAARDRKMSAAIPFLKFRAERDEVPAVKDEALKALGAINNDEANEILASLFLNRKIGDRIRLVAGETLMQNQADKYAEKFIAELDEAKAKNQAALYNGLCRIIAQAETPKLEALAARFLAAGSIVEKSYALDMILKNRLMGLINTIKPMADDEKSGSLGRKAKTVIEKLEGPAS